MAKTRRVICSLNTNIVFNALRQPAELDRLKTFLSWALPSTVLSSVVAAALTTSARPYDDACCRQPRVQ